MATPPSPHASADRRLRILFDLEYPGYLRYFDSVVDELGARGHHVEVWFENPLKQAEGLEALDRAPGDVVAGGAVPTVESARRPWSRMHRGLSSFLRYQDPRFGDADYLRDRAASRLPATLRLLRRVRTLPAPLVGSLLARLLELEQAMPVSEARAEFVRERAPDVVVASPFCFFSGAQADLAAAAQDAGVPTVAAVASWDNLTTKGLIRGRPEQVLVWNEAQAQEAVDLHGVERGRVVVTGAQPFDKWFAREPSLDADAFADRVGLPRGVPYLLFVGSTASISAPHAEQEFVRRWLGELRRSRHARLRGLAVLIRPHPFNSLHWDDADLSELRDVVVWPREGANPVDEGDRDDYYHSIYHSTAVVGINTSAMLEAAIVGRPVFTVTPDDFRDTQRGTLHFRYLLPENGGFLRVAGSLEEHLEQLQATLDDPAAAAGEAIRFVASFIRPHGLGTRATPLVADAVEAAARAGALPPVAAPVRARVLARAFVAADALDRRLDPRQAAKRLRRRAKVDSRRLRRLGGVLRAASTRRRLGPSARLLERVADGAERLALAWPGLLRRVADAVHQERPAEPRETFGRRYLREQAGEAAAATRKPT